MRISTLIVALWGLAAANSTARAQTAPDLLVHPHGFVTCHVRPSPPLQIFEFFDQLDSTQTQRQIRLAVDSAGGPVFLQAWAPEHQGSRRAAILLVGFIPGAKAVRAEGDVDAMLTETDSTRFPQLQAMSDSEVAVARALAAWLWEHRCAPHRR